MATPIAMPKLGMTMREGTVVDWPIALGARVDKGQTVLVIESEKAEVDVEATAAGHLRHVYVEVGETVPCGTLLAALAETPDEPFDVDAFRAEHDHPEATSMELETRPAPQPRLTPTWPGRGGASWPSTRPSPPWAPWARTGWARSCTSGWSGGWPWRS